MSYLEELLPEFRKRAKIRRKKWPLNAYIENNGYIHYYNSLEQEIDILAGDWEIYQEPIDWDYIIKNKCLCWFWGTFFDIRIIGTLEKLNEYSQYKFKIYNGKSYENCRPVRRDEVTFYEDIKDE